MIDFASFLLALFLNGAIGCFVYAACDPFARLLKRVTTESAELVLLACVVFWPVVLLLRVTRGPFKEPKDV